MRTIKERLGRPLRANLLVLTGALAALLMVACQDREITAPAELPTNPHLSSATSSSSAFCGTHTPVRLLAGQSTEAGSVSVGNDQTNLYVTFTTTGEWALRETHLAAGDSQDDIPTNNAGNPQVGHFPYDAQHDPAATTYTYAVPLSELGLEAGEVAHIAAHADLGGEGAWGEGGKISDESGNWAMYFTHRVQNCAILTVSPTQGGILQTTDGSVTLVAEGGDLTTETTLTIEKTTTDIGEVIPGTAYDFGPDGTTFANPVTVSMVVDPTALPASVSANDLRLAYLLEGGTFELIPGSGVVALDPLTVSGPVHHFSTLAVVPSSIQTIFRATFDADAVGSQPGAPEIGRWLQISPAEGHVQVVSSAGDLANQPLELYRPSTATSSVHILGEIAGTPPTSGTWTVQWNAAVIALQSGAGKVDIRTGTGLVVSSVGLIKNLNGQQITFNGSQIAGLSWSAGISRRFELVVDLDAKLLDLYVGGTQVANDAPFYQSTASQIGRIMFNLGGGSDQTYAWDDVQIYEGRPAGLSDGGSLSGQVVFSSERDGTRDVYVKDLATGAVTQLTNDFRSYSAPAWSPNGSRIAVAGGDLFVMNPDGSGLQRVLDSPGNDAFHPAWSPDGTQLAYIDRDPTGTNWEIYVVDLNTGVSRTLVANAGQDRYPTWSPDGSRIIFTRDHQYIYSVSAVDGSGESLLYTGSPRFPAYAPDGSKIVFSEGELKIMNLATRAVQQITQEGTTNWHPSWSPDGSRIVYARNPNLGSTVWDLWVVNSDGSGTPQQIEASAEHDFYPSWK